MKNEISSLERRLLLGAIGDILRLKRGKKLVGTTRTDFFFHRQFEVADAKAGFIRLDSGRWLGQAIQPNDRMMISRAYARLEKRGLVEKVNFKDEEKATHLFITRAGFKLVRELLALQSKYN